MTPLFGLGVVTGLADAALRAVIFAGLTGLALAAFRIRAAAARLWAWTIVLVVALAMPVVGRVVPGVRWTIPAVAPLARFLTLPADLPSVTAASVARAADAPVSRSGSTTSSPAPSPAPAGRLSHAMVPASSRSSPTASTRVNWSVALLAVYLCGVIVLLARGVMSWRATRALELDVRAVDDAVALARLDRHTVRLGLARAPALAEASILRVPVAMFVLAPTIVLPRGWRAWNAATLDAVLAHELAHVARRDTLTQRLSLVYRAITWFSPLSWWLHDRLAALAEQASDEAALAAGADRTEYAETLLGFFAALQAAPQRAGWHVAMARGAVVNAERRVEQILNWKGERTMRLTRRFVLGVLFAAAPGAALTAAVRPALVPAAAATPVRSVTPAAHDVVAPSPDPRPVPASTPSVRVPVVPARQTRVPFEEQTGSLRPVPAGFRLLLFDVPTSEPGDAAGVLRALSGIPDSDLVGAASVGDSLKMLQDLTADRTLVRSAVADFFKSPDVTNGSPAGQSNDRVLKAMQVLCAGMSKVQQKKSLMFFSRGLTPGHDNEVTLRSVTNSCNAANVSIYPVDYRGLGVAAEKPQTSAPETVFKPGNGVTDPIPIRQPEPKYTSAAVREKIQGDVELQVVVRPDGTVGDVKVSKSLDQIHGLDQEAINAAKQWKFKPSLKDGQPVPVSVTLVLTFRTHVRGETSDTAALAPPAGAQKSQTPDDEFSKGTYPESTQDLVAPRPIRQPEPKYTSDAMRAKIQGDVIIEAVVGVDGTVLRARVTQSLDKDYGLDDEALKAAKQWVFEPGTLKGERVPVLVKLVLTFRLH